MTAVSTAPPGGLTVRGFLPRDAEVFARFRADPVSAALTYGAVTSPGETVDDVRRLVESARGMGYQHWIWADQDDEAVGFSHLSSIDRVNRTLWTGSAVFEPGSRGRDGGHGTPTG